jgi:tripartite-type tricarboxylate transporter receptor subunit TctC
VGIGNWASHVLNGAVFALPYDLLQDFAPVAQIASDPQVIIARPDMPANSLSELIAWLRANPDKGTQGTGGAGSTSHVVGTLFQRETNTRFQFVPYRLGVGAAMTDLMAGQIDMMFSVAAKLRAAAARRHDQRLRGYGEQPSTRRTRGSHGG